MGETRQAEKAASHRWRFFRAGGFDQIRLESAEDYRRLDELDQKLWVALACPVEGMECDRRTLALLDSDGDGRIRVPELLAAVRWTSALLKKPEELGLRSPPLPLSAIDDETEQGAIVLAAARQVLANLGTPEAESICADDLADPARFFVQPLFNGDGIVPAEAADDPAVARAIGEVMSCCGSRSDLSGLAGVDAELVAAFFQAIDAYRAWWEQGIGEGLPVTLFGADGVLAALAAYAAIREKVEDYFIRCRLAAFDDRASAPLSCDPEVYAAMAGQTLHGAAQAVSALPLARIAAGGALPLGPGVNPAWAQAVERFRDLVVLPLLGERTTLGEADWREIAGRMAPAGDWLAAKAGSEVEPLGIARIVEIGESPLREAIATLFVREEERVPYAAAIADVERLVLFYRDLDLILNNFVSFRDFYSKRGKAVFQAGTLFIDGRSCDLCLRVTDVAKHSALASAGRIFLVYCDCTRRGSSETMSLAAAFTAGDSGFLVPGRNGLFYDRAGRDWDATIVKIEDHPISIRQAFWAPYRQIGKFIGEQIQKFAALREKAAMDSALLQIGNAGKAAADPGKPAAPPAAAQAFDVAKFAGIFAAIGLAVGAIGSAVASIVTGFLQLAWWKMPIAVAGVLLTVSGPSMFIAYVKLRDRNLGPLLDACGWAINTRAKINIPFGTTLTALARLPEGAERSLIDPYAEKRRPWRFYLLLLALAALFAILWHFRLFDSILAG